MSFKDKLQQVKTQLIHKLKRTDKVTNNVLRTLKLSNIQGGTAIVMEGLFAEINMYPASFDFIKTNKKDLKYLQVKL